MNFIIFLTKGFSIQSDRRVIHNLGLALIKDPNVETIIVYLSESALYLLHKSNDLVHNWIKDPKFKFYVNQTQFRSFYGDFAKNLTEKLKEKLKETISNKIEFLTTSAFYQQYTNHLKELNCKVIKL